MTSFRMHLIAAILLAHCIGSPARAVDTPAPSTAAPELSLVRAKIKAKDWLSAVVDLQKLAATHQHADIYNLLGFSLRNLGEYAEARSYYGKALDFDPQHKGALEYLGELYVRTGEMDKARAMAARLHAVCANGCEELDDLRRDIAAADGRAARQ